MNSTRATGPVVCTRQSTTPDTVWPSARFSAVICSAGAGAGLGFGFAVCTGFGFVFRTTIVIDVRASRRSADAAIRAMSCFPSLTRRVSQRRVYGAVRSRLTIFLSTYRPMPVVVAPQAFARIRTTPFSTCQAWIFDVVSANS